MYKPKLRFSYFISQYSMYKPKVRLSYFISHFMHLLETIGLWSGASRKYTRKVHTTTPAHEMCSLPTNYAISSSLWYAHWLIVVSRSRLHWSAFYLKNKYFQLLPVLPIKFASFCEVKFLYNDDYKVLSIFGWGPGVLDGSRISYMHAPFLACLWVWSFSKQWCVSFICRQWLRCKC